MKDLRFTDDVRETMEQFLAVFPDATRESYRNRLTGGIEYQALKKGVTLITRDMFMEAMEDTFPKSFDPLIRRFKDPQGLSEMVSRQKAVDRANPLVKVKRWTVPPVAIDRPVKKVLAIMASPRKKGNTDCIMDTLLDGCREAGCSVEKHYLSDLTISPCIGCMGCEAKPLDTFCAIKDDMTGLYRSFLDCDAFVMGFPVYTGRECAQAAVFFDRLKALRTKDHMGKLSRKRKGALVVTWGWPTDDSYDHVVENAVFILKLFGIVTAEIVTGSGFWEAYYGKGMADLDKEGMAQAKEAGRDLAK
jgi:multimeric flavodoxin WrbA